MSCVAKFFLELHASHDDASASFIPPLGYVELTCSPFQDTFIFDRTMALAHAPLVVQALTVHWCVACHGFFFFIFSFSFSLSGPPGLVTAEKT